MTVSIQLPDRHVQIIHLLSEGKTKKEIASVVKTSPHNVERIIRSYLEMFDCKNAAGLVAYSIRKGIIQ